MSLNIVKNQAAFSRLFPKKKEEKPEKPPFRLPRATAYSNEVGEALRPAIGAVGANLFWLPALTYFAMDIKDKYEKGDGNKSNDHRTALRAAIFHAAASIAGPTLAIHGAQHQVMKHRGDKWTEKIFNGLKNTTSKLYKTVENLPFGKKIADMLTNPETGKVRIKNSIKAAAGLATLALVAIPLDILTEKLLIKQVVNPALGLKDHEDNPFAT